MDAAESVSSYNGTKPETNDPTAILGSEESESTSGATLTKAEIHAASQTDTSEMASNFAKNISLYRDELDKDFEAFEQDAMNPDAPNEELNEMNWTELEQRYNDEMKARIAAEQEIMDVFNARFKQFMLWSQVSSEREATRALKRLRTQMSFVQNSEADLTGKQEHYAKVLEAFQKAMAMLGNL